MLPTPSDGSRNAYEALTQAAGRVGDEGRRGRRGGWYARRRHFALAGSDDVNPSLAVSAPGAHTVALPSALTRAFGSALSARDRLLAVRPTYVLSTLVVAQWLALLALALTVRHNGWLYYMGGDQLWHYTGAYRLVHGEIVPPLVGIGWVTVLAPIAWLAGPNLASALPAIVLLNVLVLLPVALLCLYGIAESIGGRLFGYWAALLWVVVPYVGIAYALHGYHQKWTEITLPQILGLGAMADFPSVVALLAGAYLCIRAVDRGDWALALGAGLAVGYSIAVKPSNSAFLVAPGLLMLAYRPRLLPAFAAGLAPLVALLAFWKERGYGRVPAFGAPSGHRVALGLLSPVHKYTHNNTWTQLHNNLLALREHLWSDRLLEFLVLAGIVALLLRSRRAALFVGSWFAVFLLLKGTYVDSSIDDATFWRLLLPAFPAFVLLAASVVLLVPGVRLRPPERRARPVPRRRVAVAMGIAAALLVLFPLALVAAASPVRHTDVTAAALSATLVPVSGTAELQATAHGGAVTLTWKAQHPLGAKAFYRVYRTPGLGGQPCSVGPNSGWTCGTGTPDIICGIYANAADSCELSFTAKLVGTTKGTTWTDRPGAGTWTYRLGISANWLDSPDFGDVYVFSNGRTTSIR
jgi:hypothetical protein